MSANYSGGLQPCPVNFQENDRDKACFSACNERLCPNNADKGLRLRNIMSATPTFKVVFYNQNQVYEVYARAIYQSEMYGFIEVEEFVFGDKNQLVVDPGEEKLKTEFAGVKRSYIPMHSVIRIDEVEKEGLGKVTDIKGGDKVATFPTPSIVPKPSSD